MTLGSLSSSPDAWPASLVEVVSRGLYEPLVPPDLRIPPSLIRTDFYAVAASPAVIIGGTRYEVPVGFVTDFASLRWWARINFTPAGRHAVAAAFHDYLLRCTDVPKWQCDAILYLLLRADGVSSLEATLFWLAVRTKPEATRRS